MFIHNCNNITPTKSRCSPLLIPIVALLISSTVEATVYYVSPTGADTNTGTQPSVPLKTIGKAVSKLKAGDTAILLDGTYTESEIAFKTSGTEAQPITLRAQNKNKAILSSISGCNPNISIDASYITIENIRSSISPKNIACSVNNSANGAAVRAWNKTSPTLANPSTGNSHCVIRGVLVDASPARSVGIKINQDDCLVEGNEINSSLEAFNNSGTVFRNNVINGGDVWGSSLFGKGGVRNLQIYNNVVYVFAKGGEGIVLGGASANQYLLDPGSGLEAYNSVAYNNVVINKSGANIDALALVGAKNSALFNNIVIGGGNLALRASPAGALPNNPSIKNNIFDCAGANSFGALKYTGTLTINYNNFYNCIGIPKQENSITGDPKFIDPNKDWHLQTGSPSLEKGTPTSFVGFKGEVIPVNKDKDGVTRSAPWDIGVYSSKKAPPTAPTLIISP